MTFYLSEGGFFSVPRYVEISLTFNVPGVLLDNNGTTKIQCIVTGSSTANDLYLIAVPDGWKAVINNDLTITITAPDTDSTGEILVMLDNKKGSTTIGRIYVSCGKTLTVGNLQPGQLATLIGSHTDLTSITVTSGTINKEDWEAVRKNIGSLTYIDLEGATYTGDDAANFVYNEYWVVDLPLQTIKLPQGATGIGTYAFYKCSSLKSITLPEGVTSIGDWAFENCSALTSIDLPDGLTSIAYSAFYTCWSLSSVTLPDGLESIGDWAFYECSALQSITLPDGLQSIGQSAFQNCFSLTSITLPASLTTIEEGAFMNCSALNTVTCLATTPPSLDTDVFYDCPDNLQIRVPAGSVDAYKTAWTAYADKIVAIP